MKFLHIITCIVLLCACQAPKHFTPDIPHNKQGAVGGKVFFSSVAAANWKLREAAALKEILSGNMPSFLRKFAAVSSSFTDSTTGKVYMAVFYVSPDYLSVGNDEDFARIPLTPMAGQQIADSFHCFLPTKKIVDIIYQQAIIKTEPVPMYAFRDSSITMWQHHLIIEGQRKQQKGLIAGIKKDIVISSKILSDTKPDRVAIYGWHRLDGTPIQPVYTGHVNWYVDYSHGIRLVYRKMQVNGKWMDYEDVMKDSILQKLICDEPACNFLRYDTNMAASIVPAGTAAGR